MTVQCEVQSKVQSKVQNKGTANAQITALQGFLHDLKNEIIHSYKLHQKNKKRRKALKELSDLDDVILKDIGVTRDDIFWANSRLNDKKISSELENFLKNKKSCR